MRAASLQEGNLLGRVMADLARSPVMQDGGSAADTEVLQTDHSENDTRP
jgi:hypothetical protein